MRDFYLVLGGIAEQFGGVKVIAQICVVTEAMAYKWTQDPERSGQWIPLKHLQTILAESKKHLENLKLQSLISELLNDHFATLCGRRVMLEEKIADIIFALSDGYKPQRISA